MRRTLLGWVLIVSLAIAGCSSAVGPDSRPLTGTWTGTYTCSQGLTGLTLVMTGSIFGAVVATFDFYAVPENPDIPSGRFAMGGAYTFAGEVRLDADESDWIEQPSGYRTVDLEGVVSSDSNQYSGNVIGTIGCTTFSLVRR